MVTLLSRIFIKDNTGDVRKAYGTLCSVLGIVLNILLFAGKYIAGVISSSIAIMADAFNNLSDAGSSFITLVGFRFAGKKPDPEHPFGHGRFEYISGFIVSIAIIVMGLELGHSSIDKIIHPEPVDTSIVAIGILVVSVAVKIYMCIYNRVIGKKIDSAAMKATSADSLSDSVATTVVLLSVLIMRFAGLNVDGICGVAVACFILYAGYGAAKDTISPLLGKAPDEEFVKSIEQIVMSHETVSGIHDLVVHDYGPGRVMISLHAEVPGNGDIFELHEVIDTIERELKDTLGCEAVIHMDPVEKDNEEVQHMREQMAERVEAICDGMTLHDFRVVHGKERTNLIFDVVVPFAYKGTKEELLEKLEKAASEIDSTYHVVVEFDQAYVR
ncbi:MAG: cation diffusion facilitator family transporter [Lachnospiraceae bacterium]